MDSRNSDPAGQERAAEEYNEALQWLYSQLPMFSRVGAPAYKPGLQTTMRLDEIYSHPHRKFKSIHVGGTNGKGSTSHMIAAVLQAQGYKTGLYTSPHLTDFRERMRIDGRMIPREDVVRFVSRWKEISNTPESEGLAPSFFELTMMMAFDWFAREKVDYAVIEVGMGGRLDSTNVITPVLSVITNISFDHTQFLGTTLPEIASEKAGIIKPGVPVVVGRAEGAVKDVFTLRATEEESKLIFAADSGAMCRFIPVEGGWDCVLADGLTVFVPLGGEYQKENIVTALCAVNELRETGVEISRGAIAKGLAGVDVLTGLRGRWQKISDSPAVICDTGHNVAGITETLRTLSARYPGRKVRFVLGFVSDKDLGHIVELFPGNASYYFTKASIPRALDEKEVVSLFASRGIHGPSFPSVKEAFAAASADASPEDVIYVGGSTFVVADFLA